MLNEARLAEAMRKLATYLHPFENLPRWDDITQGLFDVHRNWPRFVHEPRRLLRDAGNHWMYDLTVGHGTCHEIVNFPNGNTILWVMALEDHVNFLGQNPDLLGDRTVHFVLDAPAAMARNLRRWGAGLPIDKQLIVNSLVGDWSSSDPRLDPAWTYPVLVDGAPVCEPTVGALANLQVIEEIASTPGAEWVGIGVGRNRQIGPGARLRYSGPSGTEDTAIQLEELARHLGIKMDTAPAKWPHLKPYPGTEGVSRFDHRAARVAQDPTVTVGGTIYDYALGQGRGDVFALSPEVNMLQSLPPQHLRRVGRKQTLRIRHRLTHRICPLLGRVAEIAHELPPTNPDVVATRTAMSGLAAWGHEIVEAAGNDLSPDEQSTLLVADLFEWGRRCGPALHALRWYRPKLEARGEAYTKPFRELKIEVMWLIYIIASRIRVMPFHTAATAQIAAYELASARARGIQLPGPLS